MVKFYSSLSNEIVDGFALEANGSAYQLEKDGRYALASTLEEARALKSEGWKVIGEIHLSDFGWGN